MGRVPVFFNDNFIDVVYFLKEKPDKICIDVIIDEPSLITYTGKKFSICLRKTDRILEIPVQGSVDRAIKFQLVAKILRQENIDQ